ncbi:MAG: MFS transporter [Opitutales bacterium]
MRWLSPKDRLETHDVDRGMRMLIGDAMTAQTLGVLTGGAFLVAFALELGASNFVIGIFAAIGPFCQILQIPSIFLVEKVGNRKALVVFPVLLGRLSWLFIPFIPFLLPESWRVGALVGALVFYFGVSSVAGCAFNSWIRDLIPEEVLGRFFGKRMAWATAVGAALTLLAGWLIEPLRNLTGSNVWPYSILFLFAGLAGLLGVVYLGRIPEPRAQRNEDLSLAKTLVEPLRQKAFRNLIAFTGIWNLAIFMAAAFFGVYLLQRLEMPMSTVITLGVLSQIINVFFFRVWGTLADHWSNKSALMVAGQLFFFSILLWPFTTFPEKHSLTLPILIVIHILTGISTAGVNLCAGNLVLKNAPKGKGTSFLATNALVCGIMATLGPIIGGLLADFFANTEVALNLVYTETIGVGETTEVPAFNLRGLDFVFILAVIVGAYALHRLAFVTEAGSVDEKIGFDLLYAETRKSMTHVSNIAGLRRLTYFPFELLAKVGATGSSIVKPVSKGLGRKDNDPAKETPEDGDKPNPQPPDTDASREDQPNDKGNQPPEA